MIDIVIKYNKEKNMFGIYEPTAEICLLSSNISEALVSLEKYLKESNIAPKGILECDDICYHIDSKTMNTMIQSNTNLLKRLDSSPSGFTLSQQRFGDSKSKKSELGFNKKNGKIFSNTSFSNSYRKFGNRRKK